MSKLEIAIEFWSVFGIYVAIGSVVLGLFWFFNPWRRK